MIVRFNPKERQLAEQHCRTVFRSVGTSKVQHRFATLRNPDALRVGLLGEFAVRKAFGLPVPEQIIPAEFFGDLGVDFVFSQNQPRKDFRFQIKTHQSLHREKYLYVLREHMHLVSRVHALILVAAMPCGEEYNVLGYCRSKDFLKHATDIPHFVNVSGKPAAGVLCETHRDGLFRPMQQMFESLGLRNPSLPGFS